MGPRTTLGVYLKAISSSGSLLFLLLLHFYGGEIITGASATSTVSSFTSPSQATQQQKCDKMVEVETRELLSYLGNVTFTAPTAFHGRWTTVIKFTSPYTFIGGWGVEVQSFGLKAYAIFKRNEEQKLKAGDKIIFQFRVLYGFNVKVPKVMSIKWENTSICGHTTLEAPLKMVVMPASGVSDNDASSEKEDSDETSDLLQRKELRDGINDSSKKTKKEGGDDNDDGDAEDIGATVQKQIATNRLRHFGWKSMEKKD